MAKATRSLDPKNSSPLKWGILASGNIARQFVGDLHASGAGQAVAVGSRNLDRARAFAAEFGIPRAHGSYADLAADPEVEAVYVASPHPSHLADTLLCLKAGKAVLCEKPLTLNARQATRLFDAAQAAGRPLMEALWSWFLPAQVVARQWWTEGAIGEVKLITADFGGRVPFDPASRIYDPALGGGALLDVGCYPVAMAQMVAGNRPAKVKASATLAPTGVDESTSLILEWSSGLRAEVSCSTAFVTPQAARIYGTRGTITIPDFWHAKTAILENDQGRTVFEDPRTTRGYDFEARAFADLVRSGKAEHPLVSRAFSLRLASTLDTARRQIGVVYPGDRD